jgi:hypothetical protein
MPGVMLGMSPTEADVGKVIAGIKKPSPASIAFVEVRFSRLLIQPTVVAGQLNFLGAGHFERVVEQPYRERTEVNNDSVRVAREHEAERSFALARAPELRALLVTFAAMLSGDQNAIERDFRVSAQGDMHQWNLNLVPLDARIQRRLNRISIAGNNETPRCFAIHTHEGGVSILFLGDSASPDIAATIARDTLIQRCQSGR